MRLSTQNFLPAFDLSVSFFLLLSLKHAHHMFDVLLVSSTHLVISSQNSTIKSFKKPNVSLYITRTQNKAKLTMFHKNRTHFCKGFIKTGFIFAKVS
jgi:hypothetical protein